MAACAAAALAGCAGPASTDSGIAAPEAWRFAKAAPGQPAATNTLADDWWRAFGNSELDRLVAQASANNNDLAAAMARVDEARASARIAGAALLPTVSGFGDASHQGGLIVSSTSDNGTGFDLGLVASYELDFWGKNRATRDAARATWRASAYDRDTVALTLSADVTNAWLQAVAMRERTAIAARNLQSAARVLANVESRYRAGAATATELAQQRAAAAAQRRSLAALSSQANDSLTTLAVLLGEPVAQLQLNTGSLDAVQAPAIDAGVPSSVLVQRPDLARAEALLAAADANITVARAAMLPSLSLSASVGVGSEKIRTLFDSTVYSVAAGLTAPIFNGGALRAGRDLAVAQRRELLATYRQAIVAAFGDVERALNAVQGADAQLAASRDEVDAAQHALTLAESRYRAGAETFLTVLSAQQTLFTAQDSAASLQLARLQASVGLYRALGGGWRKPDGDAVAGKADSGSPRPISAG
ncbi:efflux transporter outer membrane subunit [Burkholderia sp. Ac-20379]|uniref:efflux transporter outer membrane subunit n=1 Tax=Burkholderia sp. Ac-20379 TaxID=2703900 RepID=UPI00197D95E0|nr:efflux transporter outer membrane subunit [Burkholderia sp. Ac-20379]